MGAARVAAAQGGPRASCVVPLVLLRRAEPRDTILRRQEAREDGSLHVSCEYRGARLPGAGRGPWLPLGFLLLVVVVLAAGSSQASAIPGASEPVAAGGFSLYGEAPLARPALRLDFPKKTLERGLALVARADLPEMEAVPADPVFPPAEADWNGLGRDTAYLIGYQFIGFLVLYVAPESISNWSEEDKEHYDFSKWVYNVTHPDWDEDKWWINYILHPYWGSAYYLDARGRGFGRWGSFWYSFFASNLYEFGTEAFAEQVSIQDFFVTPIAGSLLGMMLEESWRELVIKGKSRSGGDTALLYLIDPLGQLNHAVDRLFGYESGHTSVGLLPVIGPVPGRGARVGVQVSLAW